jgi:hypothetical protein
MAYGKVEEATQTCESPPAPSLCPPVDALDGSKRSMTELAVRPKTSKAFTVWLTLLIGVLVALFLQMGTKIESYNLLIEGDRECDGASVQVDGHPVGTITERVEAGVKVIGLRVLLADGQHTVTVSKPGFAPFTAPVKLRGADYIGIHLTKVAQ